MEASADAEQKLSAFISQLLSGVVESVRKQGYQVAFLASKCGDGRNEILSLHGGFSVHIQEQIEANFKNLIQEAAQDEDCSISESEEETIQSNHPVSIPINYSLAAASSHDDQISNAERVIESAAHMDTIKVECTSEFDASLPENSPTGDTEYSLMTDIDADVPVVHSSSYRLIDCDAQEPVEYNYGEGINEGQKQEPEPPNDIMVEHDGSLIESSRKAKQPGTNPSAKATALPAHPSYEQLRGKKKFKYCKFTTKHKARLICHIETHTGVKPYGCPQCPYKSTNRACMKRHIMTHTGEKPFACPECPYRATKQQHLNAHILTHTGEKPNACPQCPFRCAHQGSLKRHIRKHTGEKPFACPECPYRATQQQHLDAHILTHTGEKPNACPECSFRCARQSSLKRHSLTHTRERICLP